MAIKSQRTVLRVATAAGSPKTITGVTAANPPVVSSTSHGLTDGTIIVIAGIVGMTELNGRAFVVASSLTNSFELKGIDSSAYTAYASGGTATAQTMTVVSEIKSVQGFNGQAADIDVTHLSSTATEFLQGLQDFGTVDLDVSLVTDTGQAKLRSLKAAQSSAAFSITLSDARVAACIAFCQSFSFSAAGPNTAVGGSVSLRVANEPAWFA